MAEGAGREQMLQEPPPLSLKVTQWSLDIVWSSRGSHKGHSQGNGVDLCGPPRGSPFPNSLSSPPMLSPSPSCFPKYFLERKSGQQRYSFSGT